MNIVGICGSLRQKSYNLSALKVAGALMPAPMQLEIVSIAAIPLYDQDVQDRGFPVPVLELAARIRGASGVLIASPEYNFSMTGVLKNTLDWLSRLENPPFKNKPVAVFSTTGGPLGGSRNQYELRKVLGGMEALVLLRPEVFIGMNQSKFDADGELTDEATRKVMHAQMLAFQGWIEKVS